MMNEQEDLQRQPHLKPSQKHSNLSLKIIVRKFTTLLLNLASEELGMHRIATKFVLLPTSDQKQHRIGVCTELKSFVANDTNFHLGMSTII